MEGGEHKRGSQQCAHDAKQIDGRVAILSRDEACDGDDEFRQELVESFLGHTHDAVAELCHALATHDLEAAQLLSHKLTGSAGTLGAKRLSDLTRRICDDASEGHAIDGARYRAELQRVHALTAAAFAAAGRP